jgi:excinuclease UvrABC nuclease subunit
MSLVFVNLSDVDLDELPEKEAVYAIFVKSKKSKKPVNCRYVGETDNLLGRIKKHYSGREKNEYLKSFMQSDITKFMIYQLMPNSTKKDRLMMEKRCIGTYQPEYNK